MTKQVNNRIPRSARILRVEFLTDTSGSKKGEVVTIHKNDHGWVGQASNGKCYYFFASMLRNPDVCKISVVA